MKTQLLPEFMIYQSFRYVLGRMTYAVSDWVNWAVENWDNIPIHTKNIIISELEEKWARDKESRSKYRDIHFYELGYDCDREQWQRIRNLYMGSENSE